MGKATLFILLTGLTLLAGCGKPQGEARRVIVQTPAGPLIGIAGAGDFRFGNIPYAVALSAWKTPRDAGQPGAACPADPASSEACRTLDIRAPAGRTKAPVLVWLGEAEDPLFDEQALARSGVIAVVVHDHAQGVSALLDQEAALVWLRSNIASFGGDTANIVVLGDVAALAEAPEARGLFARALAPAARNANAVAARTCWLSVAASGAATCPPESGWRLL